MTVVSAVLDYGSVGMLVSLTREIVSSADVKRCEKSRLNVSVIITQSLDVKQQACPMPLLKAKQALHKMQVGQVLEVLATDKGSWRDFHAYVKHSGHVLLLAQESKDEYRYLIQRG